MNTPAQGSTPLPERAGTPATSPASDPQVVQALFQAVAAQPWAFDYFALLRRLDALHPQLPRMGSAARPQLEALRLAQQPELDFAPAALAGLSLDGPAPRLAVRFFGLLGPQGPMPLHLTEYVRDRSHNHGDATPARFLDLFHHRMLGLFYRAWAQTQPVVQRDRPHDDRYAAWLGALVGLRPQAPPSPSQGAGQDRNRPALPDTAQLYQAGLLAGRSRHPEGLARILTQFFRVPAAIHSHVPHWLPIEAQDRSRLGHARNRAPRQGGAAARLGENATVGAKVCDRQFKFRIELGPLTRAQYEAFLPGGPAWRQLGEWVRLYAGHDLHWDVQLSLRAADVGRARLGRGLRLGLSGWLGDAPAGHTGRPGERRSTQPTTQPIAQPIAQPSSQPTPRDRTDLRLRPHTSFLSRRHGALHG